MEDYLKQLDERMLFIRKEISGQNMRIFCELENTTGLLIHSRRIRVIKDIPYGDYKVELHILTKKFFTAFGEDRLTVVEKLPFLNNTGRRTKRLDDYILKTCAEMSAIGCERFIRSTVADVSDSSILRLVKKNSK